MDAHLEANGHNGEADYAKAYERRASAEKFKGDYDNSLAEYDVAIELYGRLEMYDEQKQASDGRARCLFYSGKAMEDAVDDEKAEKQRKEKIRKNLEESLATYEQSGDYLGKLMSAQSFATIAGGYAQLEDYPNALKYYSMYIPAVREGLAEDFLLKSPKERALTWKTELNEI